MEGVELEFRDDAIDAIALKAIERKTGARGLRSIMESSLKEIMFELPTINNLLKVVIDKDVINKNEKPYLIYSDNEKQANK
jgi:ATP-dependent Clp protease ATP-binding subunit ClpX